jgi:two-component system, chemotaxis family, protein-glutamate methylesterase/glutaminase
VIGGSAGSVDVLLKIIPKLPANFPLAVLIVVHRMKTEEDILLGLLQDKSIINVKEAESNEIFETGVVYIAPADYHLLIENDKSITLDFSEKVMYARPSIDVSMQFAARVYKNKLIGILLTGANEDGARGMEIIQKAGGYTIIQDPKDADVPIMPKSALKLIAPNKICTSDNLIEILNELCKPFPTSKLV